MFDEKPKFDAGVEADEEEDPKKYIQQLSGKLGQNLRTYVDENGKKDPKLEKYAINTVISASDIENMDSEDLNDIRKKLEVNEEDVEHSQDGDEDSRDDESRDDSNDSHNGEEIEETFGDLNESSTRNIEKYLLSIIDPKLKTKRMVKTETKSNDVQPAVKPIVQPAVKPNRRSMPYRPSVSPQITPKFDL